MVGRLPLRVLGGLLLAGAAALAVADPAADDSNGDDEPRLANLLFVTLDTTRPDHLGAYGYPRPTSPSLDRFAATATLFEDVTCSIPTTLPSHLTIFTGLTPDQHGVMANGVVPPANLVSIFDLLAARGHRTAAVVAAQVLAPKYLVGLGLEQIYYGDGRAPWALELPAQSVTAMAERWLETFGDEPFALWLHYYDPHEPYNPPPALAARFVRDPRSRIGGAVSTEFLRELNDDPERRAELSEADRERIVDLSNAEVCAMDYQLGRLLRTLSRRGLLERTVIVIVGDHGQAHGEHDYWGHGRQLLEPVVKVPLLIRLPGQDRGLRVAAPAETLDIVPTLIELYGLPRPASLSGRSLTPLLRGAAQADPPFRLVERRLFGDDPTALGMALYGADWKLTYYRERGVESFRLARAGAAGGLDGDGVVAAHGPEAALLAKLLALRPPQIVRPVDTSDETLKMLQALGYAQ